MQISRSSRLADNLLITIIWYIGALSPGIVLLLRGIVFELIPITTRLHANMPWPIAWLPAMSEHVIYIGWFIIVLILLAILIVEEKWRKRNEQLGHMCTYTALVSISITLVSWGTALGVFIVISTFHTNVLIAILNQIG